MSITVAVVGAGIAGLSAAVTLKRRGIETTVFEKEPFLGGRMSSERADGFVIDKAAYTFPEYHKNLIRLLEEFNIRDGLVPTTGTSSTFARGREYSIKIGSPKDFLTYKLLSLKSKKDLVKLYLYAQSLGSALDLARPTEKTFRLEEESAVDYLLENYDEEILEYVAWPIFCEILLGNPEENSKAPFLATLKNLAWFRIFNLRDGMGMLPERLARELDVRTATPVVNLRRVDKESQWIVDVEGETPQSLTFDAVIPAIPAPLVPRIWRDMPATLAKHCSEVPYSKSIVVALGTTRRYEQTSFINNLCRDNFRSVGSLVFDHHKGSVRMPEGSGLATAVLTADASRDLFEAEDEVIVERAVEEIDKIFTGFSRALIFGRAYRWEFGALQFPQGAVARFAQARAEFQGLPDDIAFAGDSFYKTSLEVSFKTGAAAADRIADALTRQK